MDYWSLANKAASELGWLPETIYTQWAWETGHFTSNNLLVNNNIAGQTWYDGCGHEKGSPRPPNEGGWYIKYDDASQGYVEFIKKNIGRYGNVASQPTVESQIDTIARDGWAADPNYASGLKSLYHTLLGQGVFKVQDGWVQVKDTWYFYANGVMVKNAWEKDSHGKWFYLGDDGSMQKSRWIKWKDKWCYVGSDGAMLTGRQTIDGKEYFLQDNGYLIITNGNGVITNG